MPVADTQQIQGPQDGTERRLRPRRWGSRIAAGVALAALIGGGAVWLSRERIARNVIDDYLSENDIRATYDIIAISPREQVIANLVIGDPARPDLTVRRVVVGLGVGWAGPEARRVTVEGARAFASYRNGTLSLGALDPLLFTGSDQPPALPAIDVVIRDGRALVASDYGAVGIKLEGAGQLDDGFAGTLAATAPGIGVEGCRARTATLFGKLTTSDGAPRLDGPLRLGGLACAGASLARADIGTALTLKRDFSAAAADLRITGQRAAYTALTGAALSGTAKLTWTPERLALAHDVTLNNVATPQARVARLAAEGSWRGAVDGSRGQWEGTLRGAGLVPTTDLSANLAAAERGSEGTLLAPLIARARGGLTRALTSASFAAQAIIRHKPGEAALIIPEAGLTTRTGTRVLALSRVSAGIGPRGILTGLSGSILAGGEGLPSINGRIEQDGAGGGWALRMALAEYAAGTNRLAIPRLSLRQTSGGALQFDGTGTASGALPGGNVQDLTIPFEGTWSQARGLAIGTRCTPVRFQRLELSGLALKGQAITLCPAGSAPMLAYRDALMIAARTGALNVAGTLGESPATLTAERLVLRYPQPFALEGINARIGTDGSELRLTAARVTGSLAGEIAGQFTGGTARLAAVPLDLDALDGRWSFADGALRIAEGAMTLTDRPAAGPTPVSARFNPLIASGASLTLADNRITADATLRHPASGRVVTTVAINHDLGTTIGRARLNVPGIMFDKSLQPEDLSALAKGVIANADGTISGTGVIDWRGEDITSSGTFGSKDFDLAAAFGPVRGLAGEVRFADLLNLTTAPDQRVTIAAINPGVEVLAGMVQFELKDGTLLSLEEATFPFMGGMLLMQPLVMDFSKPEERRYVFEIVGLDAATFVAQMELTNLGATGTFDGTVPIIFDVDGNGRIEGGMLLSRAPGGNVAYIGDLTYEDLGTMGNYAFEALRSLDYTQMRVGLGGDLAGEIITSFDFDGVRQGTGTRQNFITRRLAKLPIRFKVKVRSENFYDLSVVARSFFNPELLGNPVERGLGKFINGKFVPNPPAPTVKPVQPPESEDQP